MAPERAPPIARIHQTKLSQTARPMIPVLGSGSVRVQNAQPGRGGETASKIGSSAAAFQSFWGQLENKRVQTPRDTCAEFGEACVAGSGRFQVMLHLKPPSMPLIATVRTTAVSEIIDYNPAPVPGPVVSRRSALEALNSSRVDLDAAAAVR